MMALKKKLRSQRGETLVEVLASVLIASLSVALLIGGVTVSVNLGRQADGADAAFYEILTKAEKQEAPVTAGIASDPSLRVAENGTPHSKDIPVQVYGGEGLYAYAREAAGGGG